MEKTSKIYIAGHNGLVGAAVKRRLESDGYTNLIYKTHDELELMDDIAVENFFKLEKPEYVLLFAAKVGGILSNRDHPVEFLYNNLKIELNVIGNAYKYKAKKLMMPGSTCIYPKLADQPLREDSLLTGLLEPTNEAYAIAKIAGIKLCQTFNAQYGTNFISVMPTTIYGPNDNFDPAESHVIPALIRKFHDAKLNKLKSVVMWGTGTPRREFMHVDDMADALVYLMNNYDEPELINIGMGNDIPINDLATAIAEIIGYKGKIEHDLTKPDGTPRKLVDTTQLDKTGWKPKIALEDGLKETYRWFLENVAK